MMMLLLLALGVPQEVDRLIKDLGGEDAELRERAGADLRRLGRPAIKPLQDLLGHRDAEISGRAATILDAIRRDLKKNALRISVKPDKDRYAPGETIVLRATLTNVEDFPVVVPKFIYDGGLSADAWITVSLAEKKMPFDGDPLPQVLVHGTVEESRFVTLKPGESLVARQVRFNHLRDTDVSLKNAKVRVVPPPPGTYDVAATYAFPSSEPLVPEERELDFRGDAKRLFEESWRGALRAEARFEVVTGR